ncbi:MAG: YbhB/YbcL family Raf kinase inhibitor-like protein [Candidatus Eremiobacteraeota bacterium]|nr:YbhB/YbcL family Raf kinase inhibitor-like protein [Candidatus Eremiobacteraeota bacterium]
MMMPLLLGLTLSSSDVKTGVQIPNAFVWNKDGCHGENHTPRLTWNAPPPGTLYFILLVQDRDAPKPGGWLHLAVFHIPKRARALGDLRDPESGGVAENDFGTYGWGGPCPPPGKLHHYTFTLAAIGAHDRTLATAHLIPVYKR